MTHWTIQKKVAMGFGMISGLLFVIGCFWVQSWFGFVDSNKRVAHTYEVIEAVPSILSRIRQLESEQRGYIIFGDPLLLQTTDKQIKELHSALANITRLTQDNPLQQKRIKELNLLTLRKIAFTEQAIQIRKEKGYSAAQSFLFTGVGLQTMSAIQQEIEELLAEEKRLLELRQATSNSHASMLTLVSIGVSILILVAFCLLYIVINRAIQERDNANTELGFEIEERKKIEKDLIKAREVALQASKAKSEFLAVMSHEIRTPMNGVVGMTGLLLETKLNNEQMEYVETIRKSGESLISLINDLLDFSKIESEKLELEIKPFDLRQCVEDAIDLMAPKAIEKNLDLFYFVEPETPSLVSGDVTRLRQVLVNLLNNAIKFTERGHILVEVSCIPSSQDILELHFSVSDTGIGISSDKRHKIFEAFSQEDSSTTRKYGGTGLGLSISNKLVQVMGGRIWVESELGKGSSFNFTVQCQRIFNNSVKTTDSALLGKTVMILDGNEMQQSILQKLCTGWGMKTVAVNDVHLANEQLQQPDHSVQLLIIHDEAVHYETFGAMLSKSPLPTIIITGFKQSHAARETYPESIILMKPYKHEQLKVVMEDTISGKPAFSKVYTAQGSLDSTLAQQYPMHILIVEDHPVNQKLAKSLLEKMGYLPDIAGNGKEAIAALEAKRYDLVFMDVQMPEMDGLEATRQILRRWPGDETPVIIAMTAYASKGDKASCLAAGMHDFIRKPILKDELQNVVKKWAQQHNKRNIPLPPGLDSVPDTQLKDHLIDMETLLERVDNDYQLRDELVELFIVECPKLLEKIRDAASRKDYQALHSLAHTVKGMCQNICIYSMQEAAKKLEQSTTDPQQVPDELQISLWIREIEDDFEAINFRYQQEVGNANQIV